jgi:transposase
MNGVECDVVNPADVPTSDKEKKNKRDKRDSGKLARELENGSLVGIYAPSEEDQKFRSLTRLTVSSMKNMTRIKNMIKSHMYYHGAKIPGKDECSHWSGIFIRKLESMCKEGDAFSDYLLHCIESLKAERARYLQLLKTIKKHLHSSGKNSIVTLLDAIPGIAFKTALILVSELIEIKRFKNLDHLCSYAGFVPSCKCSGDFDKDSHITSRANGCLRYILIEAAWMAIKKDRTLFDAYREYKKRMTGSEAIIRIAKKLLARVRYVWLNQKELEYNRI